VQEALSCKSKKMLDFFPVMKIYCIILQGKFPGVKFSSISSILAAKVAIVLWRVAEVHISRTACQQA
jgi:hypothetical protein